MATATKKFPPRLLHTSFPGTRTVAVPLRSVRSVVDVIYRFLASLKLAVLSIDRAGGDAGLRDVFRVMVWRGGGTAVHLPEPRIRDLAGVSGDEHPVRGLDPLPVEEAADRVCRHACRAFDPLLGSYYSFRTADEGQVGMLEGDVQGELVRIDYPVIRVREVDPHTRQSTVEYDLPFRPGPFEWGPGNLDHLVFWSERCRWFRWGSSARLAMWQRF